ncbi:hypothetical protein [Sporosarcina obsidiansis]|uniref:hypothetical protein n=1 Tax=Sporosarcina obsidiansis TaxID=2660748 RepID=UPI00129BF630|nr:hypothetical protein [Sporosarcina obsidiansis]
MLKAGITGFGYQLPLTDATDFIRVVYHAAREIGEQVTNVVKAEYPMNFHSAILDNGVYILLNAHYPIVAFATKQELQYTVIDLPVMKAVFQAAGYSVLSKDEAGQSVSLKEAQQASLLPDEIEQIRYWQPNCLSDLIFNDWD